MRFLGHGRRGPRSSRPQFRWRASGGNVRALLAALALAVTALAGCHHLYPMPGPAYHIMLYLAGQGRAIRAVNARTMALAPSLEAPGEPLALAYNPARAELYALVAAPAGGLFQRGNRSGGLAVFSLASRAAPVAIRLAMQPRAMALSSDGAMAYIAGLQAGHGALLAMDLPSRTIVHRLALRGRPAAVALAPTGIVLVAIADPPALDIIRAPGLRRTARILLPAAPTQVIALPYGHKAFVLCPAANQVAVVDLAPPAAVLTYLSIGPNPKSMALKPDGGELFVSNYGDNGNGTTVSAVDTTANQVEGSIVVGAGPWGLAISPGGRRLYVANHHANTVDVINLQTRHLLAAIPVGLGPEQLRLGRLGAFLFVADQTSDDIGVIRTDIPALVTLLPSLPDSSALQVASFRTPAATLHPVR